MNPILPKSQEEQEQAPKPEIEFVIPRRAFKNWDRDNEDRAKAKLLKEKLVYKWYVRRGTLGTIMINLRKIYEKIFVVSRW